MPTLALYSIMFPEEWKQLKKIVAHCRWHGISFKDNVPKLMLNEDDSPEKRERVELVANTLSNYPQLYAEIMGW